MDWKLYILECSDGTLYTGITDNIDHRVAVHNLGRGAKYTRGRTPVILRYVENCADHSAALRREYAVKGLTRAEKLRLCASRTESEG